MYRWVLETWTSRIIFPEDFFVAYLLNQARGEVAYAASCTHSFFSSLLTEENENKQYRLHLSQEDRPGGWRTRALDSSSIQRSHPDASVH